jgi:hypothetical protein
MACNEFIPMLPTLRLLSQSPDQFSPAASAIRLRQRRRQSSVRTKSPPATQQSVGGSHCILLFVDAPFESLCSPTETPPVTLSISARLRGGRVAADCNSNAITHIKNSIFYKCRLPGGNG